ncbi:MAG: transposase [Saprospiraceae bacterium]|nr:transposase [Saprospiraceae bacterium]
MPSAAITFDRFHVTKVVNKAMDDLRRIERQECSELKNHKYTLLKNIENLSDKKFDELLELITLYPKLGEGYRLKELLREFWNFKDTKMAEKFLKDWCRQADKSGIFPFQKAANTIRAIGRESSTTSNLKSITESSKASTPKSNSPKEGPEATETKTTL